MTFSYTSVHTTTLTHPPRERDPLVRLRRGTHREMRGMGKGQMGRLLHNQLHHLSQNLCVWRLIWISLRSRSILTTREGKDGILNINLLASKTRVAPLPKKKLTLKKWEVPRKSENVTSHRIMENNLLVGLPRHTWMESRRSQSKEFIDWDPKSSRNDQKIFQTQLALSWPGKASRSCLAGSASTSTGRVAAVVEWSSLV